MQYKNSSIMTRREQKINPFIHLYITLNKNRKNTQEIPLQQREVLLQIERTDRVVQGLTS